MAIMSPCCPIPRSTRSLRLAAIAIATLPAAAMAQPSGPPGPDVRVVNGPSQPVPVRLGGPVAITTTAPLPVAVVGAPVPQPFQFTYHSANPLTNQGFVVPVGKRLVIEHVSCSGSDTVDSLLAVEVHTRVGIETTPHLCPFTVRADMGRMAYAGSLPMRAHADGGTRVGFQIYGFGFTSSRLAFASLSGYLVDQP